MAHGGEHTCNRDEDNPCSDRQCLEARAGILVAMLDASMLAQESMRAVKDLLVISDWMTTTEERRVDE